MNGIYETNITKEKIDLLKGYGKFVDSKTIEVEGKQYQANNILIATGSQAKIPDNIPGAELGLTSDGFFAMENLPKKVTNYF